MGDKIELFLVAHGERSLLYTYENGKLLRLSNGSEARLREIAAARHPGVTINAFAPLRMVCSYCGKVLRDVAQGDVSHGMCDPACEPALRAFGRSEPDGRNVQTSERMEATA